MFINSNLAQRIVSQIGEIIKQNINFMDKNAIIIASTDRDRVGHFHEGAKIVLQTKEIYIIRTNDEYLGVKNGINIPILFNNEIVGVLGITGIVEEVMKYGRIVKQMTEILILEQYSNDLLILERKKSEIITQEVLFNSDDYPKEGSNTFLGVDFTQKFRGIIIKLSIEGNTEHQYYINEALDQTFNFSNQSTFTYLKNGHLYILSKIVRKSILNDKLESFSNIFKKYIDLSFLIGVGNISSSIKDLKTSIEQAEKVVYLKEKNENSTYYFEDLDLGVVLTAIDSNTQDYYTDKILSKIPEDKMEYYKNIFLVYEKHNKSIKACAEELYIHKNTFQYQLNKITEYTGYNPTILRDFVILKLAFSFWQLK